MHDHYEKLHPVERPRLLVLGSSHNTDRKFTLDASMLKLETPFSAKLFGMSERRRKELLALPDRPADIVVLYYPALRSATTRLFQNLLQLDPEEKIFRKHFSEARHVLNELGACGSDLVWRRAVMDIEASIPEDFDEDDDTLTGAQLEMIKAKVKIRNIVKNWAYSMPNQDPSSRGLNVSPKYLKLIEVLETCKAYGDQFREVVFGRPRVLYVVGHVLTLFQCKDGQ